MNIEDMTIDIEEYVDVAGSPEDVFEGMVYRFGSGMVGPDGSSMNMNLETWAGGRWYRDRGEGIQHLWGHVQSIKPAMLLELSGPMFMSYPALNHIELKVTEIDGKTRLTMRHRAVGMIDPQHREGVRTGWKGMLEATKQDVEKSEAA